MDCELYPKGSERPEERHGLFFILEKSLWLCCGRKGLGMVIGGETCRSLKGEMIRK